jgi:Raf kinase inhibitor-like YbhB/YbcL family protein
MRTAYALLGLVWLLVIAAAAYGFNHNFSTSGDTATIINSKTLMATSTLTLTSSAFENNASIPARFTCDGDQVNPPLSISGVPAGAKSLALIMDDPDVPKQLLPTGVFNHWVLFNIPPQTTEIATGMTVGTIGANGSGKNQYTGPCPPTQYEPSEHRYIFNLYALDIELPLQVGATKTDVEKAMQGHVIAQTQLLGKYKKQ